jgi:hypothetical protein
VWIVSIGERPVDLAKEELVPGSSKKAIHRNSAITK